MHPEGRSNWVSGAAIVAVLVVCAQVGYVRYAQVQETGSLARELRALRRESDRSIQRLSRQLDAEKAQVARLRVGLARSKEEKSLLEGGIDVTSSTVQVLRNQVTNLSETLREEPPFLDVRLTPDAGLYRVVAVVENRGMHPVEIFETRGLLSIGGAEELVESAEVVTVDPLVQTDFFEYRLLGDEPKLVTAGSVKLRGALCVAYERLLSGSSSPWVEEFWFEYEPGLRTVAILSREAWPLYENEVPCDLAQARRPW